MEPADEARDDRDGALKELLRVARAQWTGQLFFSAAGQVEGSIVLYEGRVAWAVSAQHQEDLGTFLWRLGRVSKAQIAEVRRKYEKHLGARKLGSLLEEEGLITRAALRRCLLLLSAPRSLRCVPPPRHRSLRLCPCHRPPPLRLLLR